MNYNKIFLIILVFLLLIPIPLNAAEVLQVRSATLLEIGDQNRNYQVKIGCINIDSARESEVRTWLKSQLPRKTRVNFRPLSAEDGVLIARVIPLGNENDLTSQMIAKGYGLGTCNN